MTNLTSLCNVAFHWLTSGFMQMASILCSWQLLDIGTTFSLSFLRKMLLLHLNGGNHIQNFHLGRYIVGYKVKVSKVAKIRNRYNQVPHLTQDTNGKVTNSQKTPQTRAKRSALSQQVTTFYGSADLSLLN